MLHGEQTFFLSVLADHLNGRPTEPVSGLDWKSVYDLAVRHQVSALFYVQCGAFLPPEAELCFLQDFGSAVTSYAARQKIVSDLDREFTLQGIPYVIVKGLAVAKSYPQQELRTMGDIDVIVKAGDKKRAHAALLNLGFHNTRQQDREWIYWQDSYEIELHHRLLYDVPLNEPSSRFSADRMWDHVQPVPGSSRCELSPEFHFLFLVMHLKKHVVAWGAGFRQFMDLAVAAQKWTLDWSRLDEWLAEAELRSFAKVCLTLCRTWFQLPLPLAGAELSPEDEQKIRQRICRNGVFGFDDKANRYNFLIDRINADGVEGVRRRFRMCRRELTQLPDGLPGKPWSILFPGYEILRKTAKYGFINHHPWMLPFAWFYRFIHGFWYRITQAWLILLFRRSTLRERSRTLEILELHVQPENHEYDHH